MLSGSVKAVFFDLYGTLLVFNDFDDANDKWTNAFYNLAGKPNNIGFDEVQIICKDILESHVEKDSSKGFTTYETKIYNSFEQKNIVLERDQLRNIADTTVGIWQKNIALAKETKSVLSKLKETKKLALISNFDHSPHIYKVLTETGLENYFDFILISDEAEIKKPDPEIFNSALKHFSLNPEQAIYVGDNIYDDIKGAFNSGIEPILISRKSKSNNHVNTDKFVRQYNLPKFKTIESLSELIDILL